MMRTPKNAYNAAAGKDMYEPEMMVAELRRLGKNTSGQSIAQWLVRWVGWTVKDDTVTWEPIGHLAGCEDMLSRFFGPKFWGFLMGVDADFLVYNLFDGDRIHHYIYFCLLWAIVTDGTAGARFLMI